MYNLLLVDVERDSTKLHRMNVITGDYLNPRYITGSLIEQSLMLSDIIRRERPDKIIFDKAGNGYALYSFFMQGVHIDFTVDAFGLIMYKDGNYGS
jgi:hypothetical protein